MNTLSKIIGGSGIIAILSIPFIFSTKDLKPVVNVTIPEQGKVMNVGGSQPDIVSPYFTVNGRRQWVYRYSLANATNTPCSIQTPAATTTLVNMSIRFDTSTTSATIVDIAKGSTQTATTSKLAQTYSIGANAQATILASSTPTVPDANLFSPSNWLNVNMSGPGTVSPVGVCQATFEEI